MRHSLLVLPAVDAGLTLTHRRLHADIQFLAVLDFRCVCQRLASQIMQDVRGDVQAEDRRQGAKHGQNANSEVVKGPKLFDSSLLELLLGKWQKFHLARDLG